IVPYFIECLLYIKKNRRKISFVFKGVDDYIHDSITLFRGFVFMSEPKLITGNNLLRNILENIASKLMGLYDDSIFSGLLGFEIIIISAHYHCDGKGSNLKMELNINVKNIILFRVNLFTTFAVIRSCPVKENDRSLDHQDLLFLIDCLVSLNRQQNPTSPEVFVGLMANK
ncbi:hypothetical protein FF38_13716, partial [Lucilia cuprina]